MKILRRRNFLILQAITSIVLMIMVVRLGLVPMKYLIIVRLVLVALCDSYDVEQLENDTRTVMRLHPAIAPYKAAVLPLSKQLNENAQELLAQLSKEFSVTYDETASIGKRYRRQDAIGTPFCITYDFDSLNDNCVTVRERDSMKQIRLPISEVASYINEKIKF